MLLPVTKEERTLLRKAIIPRRPEPAATPCWGQVGHRGGSPCPPPALGSRIRRYLFLDQPPAPTGSRLGSPASAVSASPCPRPWRCCGGLQPPGSCRTDSGVTAGGSSRSRRPRAVPGRAIPPRTAVPQPGHPAPGPAGWALAGLAPAASSPSSLSLPTAAPSRRLPGPPVTRHTAACAARRGTAPPLATFIPNHAPRAHVGSAGTAGTGCRAPAPRDAAVGCSRASPPSAGQRAQPRRGRSSEPPPGVTHVPLAPSRGGLRGAALPC